LRASGYRVPVTEGHHEKTLNSLRFTIGSDSKLIARLNGFRKKRINIIYDIAGTTSQSEFDDIQKLTVDLFDQIKKWLKKNHPELFKNK
jgi:predicted CopG family antitoxin